MTKEVVPMTTLELKALSVKVLEWVNRYDIEKSFYEDLFKEHEKNQKFIEDNPAHFHSKKEYDEACCLSAFIIICLLARINEINSSCDQ